MYLVDTNVLSAGAPAKRASAEFIAWMDAQSALLWLSAVTVVEDRRRDRQAAAGGRNAQKRRFDRMAGGGAASLRRAHSSAGHADGADCGRLVGSSARRGSCARIGRRHHRRDGETSWAHNPVAQHPPFRAAGRGGARSIRCAAARLTGMAPLTGPAQLSPPSAPRRSRLAARRSARNGANPGQRRARPRRARRERRLSGPPCGLEPGRASAGAPAAFLNAAAQDDERLSPKEKVTALSSAVSASGASLIVTNDAISEIIACQTLGEARSRLPASRSRRRAGSDHSFCRRSRARPRSRAHEFSRFRQRETGALISNDRSIARRSPSASDRQLGLQRVKITGEGGFDQHAPARSSGWVVGVEDGGRAAERMADQDERLCDPRGRNEPAEVVGHLGDVRGALRRVAEPEPRAIVGADAREGADLRLHEAPGDHAVAGTGFQHNDRLAGADAMEIEPPRAVDRDKLLRRRVDAVGNEISAAPGLAKAMASAAGARKRTVLIGLLRGSGQTSF